MKALLETGQSPSICASITGRTKIEILEQLKTMISLEPDVMEWRADFFDDLADTTTVLEIIMEMRQQTDIPILFTIRATHEGGAGVTLDEQDKVLLLLAVCEYSEVDLIDYEMSNEAKYVHKVRQVSKENGKQLILSYHNFFLTPEEAELVDKAELAVEYEADVAKFAVMPKDKEDVFHLLHATRTLDTMLNIPVVTMSMGELGALSRVVGWAYGSAMTFGVGVGASAPGQTPVKALRDTIYAMKSLLPPWE